MRSVLLLWRSQAHRCKQLPSRNTQGKVLYLLHCMCRKFSLSLVSEQLCNSCLQSMSVVLGIINNLEAIGTMQENVRKLFANTHYFITGTGHLLGGVVQIAPHVPLRDDTIFFIAFISRCKQTALLSTWTLRTLKALGTSLFPASCHASSSPEGNLLPGSNSLSGRSGNTFCWILSSTD